MDYYRQNELPETVKRYKTYTDQFQAWLLKTAFQRGVEIANVATDHAKKKKNKKGYRIPLQKQAQLVNAIAATSVPLADTSGLDDLGDAIRSRREVTQYHKHNNTADPGHEYFNGSLEALMTVLKHLVPDINKARNGENDTPTLVFITLPSESSKSQDEQDDLLDKMRKWEKVDMNDGGQQQQTPIPKAKAKAPIQKENPLTAEEEQLGREFLVLCFLYTFNRIRDVIYEVWVLYHKGLVNAMTAALVTDLAQDHVHQNVKALVEELELLPGDLATLIRQLFDKIKTSPYTGARNSAIPLTEQALRNLFCLDDAAPLIKDYAAKRPTKDGVGDDTQEHPLMRFLRFFDVIRKGSLKLPKWDHFTAEMLLHQSTSQDYLPFGLTIVLDIQGTVREDYCRMLRDLTEHGLDIARRIRCHVDYEDRMWANGTKPDYMCKEEIKFSTLLLKPLDRLLEWLQDVLNSREVPMSASIFITIHSTLAGLSMWHYNQIYHHTTIAKIQWFINGLAHLYNAAYQISGLNIRWPDLDYLIKMHGSKALFRGDPPTHPNDFLNRYLLSGNTSSRAMAADFRNTSKYLPRVSKEVGAKRGLRSDLPLEAKISDYYGPNPGNDRWLRRHAVFNHLYRLRETMGDASNDGCEKATRVSKDLRGTFADLATKITPSKPRRKGKNKSRVRKPDFDKQDETHANLLGIMKSELQGNEVHSNFDFLSFYRRAFKLVLRLREEVLMSDDVRRSRAEDMNADPEPHNFQLITDLFRALQIEPKTKKEEEAEAEEGAGQQLSTKVVPLKQIRRVAEMMHALTCAKGDVELKRAKLRVEGDWEGLKASYVAEEAENEASGVDETVVQAEDEVVSEVSDAQVDFVHSLNIIHGVKRKFEPDRDLEDGPTYTPGIQILRQDHAQGETRDRSGESTSLEVPNIAIDAQDDGVPSCLEGKRNGIKRKHEAGKDLENGPVDLPNSRDWNKGYVNATPGEHIPTSIARKPEQGHFVDDQIRQIMGTAATTSLATLIENANKLRGTESMVSVPLAAKIRHKPKGIYHRITYSSTTSRKFRIMAVVPSFSAKTTKRLALTQLRRGLFHRLSGTAKKHRIAFRCYTQCVMARALHGRQTRLQRQMAIAVAELRKKARRDSAELEKVWSSIGDADMGRVWETDSDVSLD